MNYMQLRAFHMVATQGSFTKAAEALHVTQPTLSDHVKALQDRYNVKLFERQGRGVILTGMGKALLEITRRQFNLESEAEQLLGAAQGLSSGQLRVMADAPYMVIPLIAEFHRLYPNIKLSIRFGNSEEVLNELLAVRADIAVVPNLIDDERLFRQACKRDRIICFVNQDHPLARRGNISLQDLVAHRLLIRESGSTTRLLFEQGLKNAKLKAQDTLEIGSREGVREAAAAGLGVGIVSESEMGHDLRLRKIRISNKIPRVIEFYACLIEKRPMPVINAFFELLSGYR